MPPRHRWQAVQQLLREELAQATRLAPSTRLWEMPVAAALASALPLLIGAWFQRMDLGMVASLGGLVFLYMPNTALMHRMLTLMVCASGMTACFTLGILSHLVPALMMPVLIFITVLVTALCRLGRVGPPGNLFFIMTAAIGAYTPVPLAAIPQMVGLLAMGALLACLMAFFYSVYALRRQPPVPPPNQPVDLHQTAFEALVIGTFVGASLALAQLLQLPKAYWVPVSCLAIIQAPSLRAIWVKPIHRLVGTAIGLVVAWALLLVQMDAWTMAFTMMGLTFLIETLIVRNYTFAAVFITPLTILLAEAATLMQTSPSLVMQARLIDTVLGCAMGVAGGLCLHNTHLRARADRLFSRWLPRA